MIRTENVVKSFDGFNALDGLDMNVPAGSVYGLIGPNGSGKTTIMRCMMGVYRPEEGRITIDGLEVFDNAELKQRVCFIPDEPFFLSQANSLDMKSFYKGLYERFDEDYYEKLGEVFRDIKPKQSLKRLSRGMKKQAAFRLALSCRPDVLMLDEPVDGLDPVARKLVWGLILEEVSERGLTVLVSSHNLRELEDVCDHVGLINRGKLLLEGSVTDLQGRIRKIQTALPDGAEPDLSAFDILSSKTNGRVREYIVRDGGDAFIDAINAQGPLFIDALPLTLEELFIYELGGENDEIKKIIA